MTFLRWFFLSILLVAHLSAGAGERFDPRQEVQMPAAQFKKLDTFEAHELGKADKSFNDGAFRRAAAEYDAFMVEFPRSPAIPYALLRKGRSLHLDDKRFEAIKEYNEILDYFPNEIHYAGAALYYIGLASMQNGDAPEAVKHWAEVAEDVDYRKHPLAADAINRLADHLRERDQYAKAVGYYEQVAKDFRENNNDAARYAISKVVPYYVRVKPTEARLREFYKAVGTFGDRPERTPDDLSTDSRYWETLRRAVRDHGQFNDVQAGERRTYYGYWANQLQSRLTSNDEFQLDVAGFFLQSNDDQPAWMKRLDDLYKAREKPGDYDRILKWISAFAASKPKVNEYYAKLDLPKMTNDQVVRLLKILYEDVRDADMGRNTFAKLAIDKMEDRQKAELARYFWDRDGDLVEQICRRFSEADYGLMELLRFYERRTPALEKVAAVADSLAKSEKYAKESAWIKGSILMDNRKYAEAILAFRAADNPPENLWRIADCLAKQGKPAEAIAQLREVENFFPPQAPEAALRVAYLYRESGNRDRFVSELRNVLKKYPKSGQSSRAHEHLEELGVRIGGGTDAE